MQPPPVLALHLNRSAFYGYHAVKNNCRVKFDEYLDLSNCATSGALSTIPSLPISSPTPSASSSRSSTPTPSLYSRHQTIYRLSAVVCYYGQRSFGHYVAYRRKPRPVLRAGPHHGYPALSVANARNARSSDRYETICLLHHRRGAEAGGYGYRMRRSTGWA